MTDPDCRIGIDLGGTKIEAVRLGPAGEVQARRRVATPRDDYAATLAAIVALVAALEGPRRLPVGIGTPGTVVPANGRMKNCNSTWLNGRPLAAELAAALARPVRLANDADCLTLSEAVDGAGRGAGLVFGVILGTGVGGGIAADGQLLRGANGLTGEWGHNPLPWAQGDELPGPACWCGRRGCLESCLSGPALGAQARAAGVAADAPALVAALAAGVPGAQAVFAAYVDRLARGLAQLINVLDPAVIVLGGGLSRVEALYAAVPARWGRYVFGGGAGLATALRPARHGDSSGVRGAAWLWPATSRGELVAPERRQ